MLRICFILFVAAFTGCTTIQVTHDYNPKTDFSQFKTYGWLNDIDQPSEDVRVNNKLVRSSVRAGVEETLDSKGFVKTEKDKADFLITWFGAIEKKIKVENIDHFYAPYGYGTLYRDPYWNSQPTTQDVTEYEKGTLIFDFLDPDQNALIWRATGTDKLGEESKTEDQARKGLKEAVSKIIAGFPPNE